MLRDDDAEGEFREQVAREMRDRRQLAPAIDATQLLAGPAEPTSWTIEPWVADGSSVLLGAHGGTGKSWLSTQLAACLASGSRFLGMPTARRRVGVYSAEDRRTIIRWRLRRICEELRIVLQPGWLHIFDQTRRSAELLGRGERGAFGFTVLFDELRDEIERLGVEVLIIDSASDAFGGAEIVRSEVRRYIAETQSLVPDSGAVIHLVHVDKAHARGSANGQGYSGSTAWHNSVRQRWELSRPIEDADDIRRGVDQSDPRRVLKLAKNNYGPAGAELNLTFDADRGIFVPSRRDTTGGDVVQSIDRRVAEHAVLKALADAQDASDPFHASERANLNVYRRLGAEKRLPRRFASDKGRKALFDLLIAWRADGLLAEESVVRNRNSVLVWHVTPAGRERLSSASCAS